MNRRNFLNNILIAGASFSILPGAGRVWVASRIPPYVFSVLGEVLHQGYDFGAGRDAAIEAMRERGYLRLFEVCYDDFEVFRYHSLQYGSLDVCGGALDGVARIPYILPIKGSAQSMHPS